MMIFPGLKIEQMIAEQLNEIKEQGIKKTTMKAKKPLNFKDLLGVKQQLMIAEPALGV